MSKQPTFSVSIFFVLAMVALATLLFSRGLSFGLLLLVTEAFAVYMSVELLTQGIPESLREQSRDNCYRLDGTRSQRRSAREHRAMRKIRSDLWAVFLVVYVIATVGVFIVHTCVFPLPLVAEVAAAVRDNPADLKSELRHRHVDDKFFHWSRSSTNFSNREIDQHAQLLWMSWPIALLLTVASVGACLAMIRSAYLRTLREFHNSTSARTTEYLNLDSTRLQQRYQK